LGVNGAFAAAKSGAEIMFRELVQRFVSSKYTQALEAEVARLRAENRALLNSILGVAGVPPIVVADNNVSPGAGTRMPAGPVTTNSGASGAKVAAVPVAQPRRVVARAASTAGGNEKIVAPMRRRSWHQIFRTLEINSARKKETGEIL
jgi:hypothetical protein